MAKTMQQTVVILKPGAIQRELAGEVITRFERKGLRLCGMKMMQLDDAILSEHYAHLSGRDFFPILKAAMMASPVVVCCWEGIDAVNTVRLMTGATVSRDAELGTIRGDFGMSSQENIIHASDSVENAEIERNRFFKKEEIFEYKKVCFEFLYASDELER